MKGSLPNVGQKYTPPQLARLWGIDSAKVLTWIRNGSLKAIDASSNQAKRPRFLIDAADLVAFEAARAVEPIRVRTEGQQ